MNFEVPSDQIKILPPLVEDFLFERENANFLELKKPSIQNIINQIEKRKDFSQHNRNVLVQELEKQYSFLSETEKAQSKVWKNIQSLKNPDSFTIATGQQIHIFLGPMYVFYKILSVIELSKQLKKENPKHNFIPVFWMASEDHDFEEVNFIKLWGKRFDWHAKSGGAVGEIDCNSLASLTEDIIKSFNINESQKEVFEIFKHIYSTSKTLAVATTRLINHFFGSEGLIAIDANKKDFKILFSEIIKKEITESVAYKSVSSQNSLIKSYGYKTQILIKDINLFLFTQQNNRERLSKSGENEFILSPSNKRLTQNEILKLIESSPEVFSPNVALRPIYQELVLPNLLYVGGAAELNYWFQLPQLFKNLNLTCPILVLRFLNIIVPQKKIDKWLELGLKIEDILLSNTEFEKVVTNHFKSSTQKESYLTRLEEFGKELQDLTFETNSKLVKDFKKDFKEIKGIINQHFNKLNEQMEKLNADKINSAQKIREISYPEGVLQERSLFFLEWLVNSQSKNDSYQDLINIASCTKFNISII